jgi:hypothetical protein
MIQLSREQLTSPGTIAVFGDKTHAVIDRTFASIPSCAVTSASKDQPRQHHRPPVPPEQPAAM